MTFFIQNLYIYCHSIYLTFQNWHSGYVCIIRTQILDVTNRCNYIYIVTIYQHIPIKDCFIILQLLGSLHCIEELVNTFNKLISYLYFQKCSLSHSHVRNRLNTLNTYFHILWHYYIPHIWNHSCFLTNWLCNYELLFSSTLTEQLLWISINDFCWFQSFLLNWSQILMMVCFLNAKYLKF